MTNELSILREECRKIFLDAGIKPSIITSYLGAKYAGKTKPLSQKLSYDTIMKVYKNGGDIRKLFEWGRIWG